MKIVLVLCWMSFVLPTSAELSSEEEWNNFKAVHNKKYRSKEEEIMRMRIFLQNKRRVDEHNKGHDNGLVSFKTGINKFSDLTVAEFNQRKKAFPPSRRPRILQTWNSSSVPNSLTSLHSLDWRTEGAVTGVKDQGLCQSCWIFSAVGAVEAQHFLKTKELVSLSVQNVLDCFDTELDIESGCPMGWMDDTYEFIKKNNGIDTDESYPYEAKPSTCRFNEASIGATIDGYKDLPAGDETSLRRAITAFGPISVAIDTKDGNFIHYQSGVYFSDGCKNGEEDLDHAVLVIGYGKEKGLPYWLVKNSWGTGWGEEGYAKIARNKDNHCGIATKPSYPYIN